MGDECSGPRWPSGGSCRDRPAPPESAQTIGVLGAGLMGRAIAVAAAQHGLDVRLSDTAPDVLAGSVAACHDVLGRLSFGQGARRGEVRPIVSEAEWTECDVLIEAVLEKLAVKRRVLSRLEPKLRDDCLVASNTSSLCIADIAAALQRPQRMCGLHFLHPVAQRDLVEVVPGPQTCFDSLQRGLGFVAQLNKTAIQVRDCPGFVVNRLLMAYLGEALVMLTEGTAMATLERAAIALGMPMGPMAQIDQIGVDVVARVGASFSGRQQSRPSVGRLLKTLYESRSWGCKTGRGFYRYGTDGTIAIDQETQSILKRYVQQHRSLSRPEIGQRLGWTLALEASCLLEERVVGSIREIDLATSRGLGFSGQITSVFDWVRLMGLDQLLDWSSSQAHMYPHLQPTRALLSALGEFQPSVRRAA